ncbi:flagellar hook-basal body protein [Desulfoscipio sp. XC116]|uniref:flagellar hook-basal body protein n=1 Tax=Desulfoscipio sp. XC116 TaxID=3144975 RepID=UPI00325B1949
MIRSMYLGLSGMHNYQVRLDVVGNNIANASTTGFKAGRAGFQDAMYMAMGADDSCQIGTGLTVSDISNNFKQGITMYTGRTLDLAVNGNGFFAVTDEESDSDRLMFTRDGSFYIDEEGYIVNSSGLRLVSDGEDSIQIELAEGQSLDDVYIDDNGDIYVTDPEGDVDDDPTPIGRIGLFNFANVNGLTNIGDNLYLNNDLSGEPLLGEPGTESFGVIKSGFLENSNTDMAQEMANLIETQRGYQASTKVFTTADEVLQSIIELKR